MSKNASSHELGWTATKNQSKRLSNKTSFWDLIVRSEETQQSSLRLLVLGGLPAARIFLQQKSSMTSPWSHDLLPPTKKEKTGTQEVASEQALDDLLFVFGVWRVPCIYVSNFLPVQNCLVVAECVEGKFAMVSTSSTLTHSSKRQTWNHKLWKREKSSEFSKMFNKHQ